MRDPGAIRAQACPPTVESWAKTWAELAHRASGMIGE